MKSFFQFLSEASAASTQARKLNLKSDGHGGWLDSRGKFVATTEDGKLKFADKKKAKSPEDTKGQPKAQARPEPTQQKVAKPEVTAKISKMDLRIYEVGIKYYGRSYKEGKKITWKDGFSAIRCILYYNLFSKILRLQSHISLKMKPWNLHLSKY